MLSECFRRACLLTAIGSAGLLGCGHQELGVAMIPRTTASPIWEAAHAGARMAAAKHAIPIYWNAPTSEDDVQQQASLIDRVVDKGYTGLIVAPDLPLALTTSIERAISKGISTVIIASPMPFPARNNLAYIVNDDEAAGRMAAMRIGKILHGKGRVAVLGINPESLSELDVLHSFEAAIEESLPGIVIADRRTGTHSQAEAQEIAGEELATQHDLKALFTLSAVASNGAIRALQSQQLAGKIRLVGFEQSAELADRVRTGLMDSLIAEDSYEMGYRAIQLLAANRGKKLPAETIKLEPTLLTRENIDLPPLQHLTKLEWGVEP